MTKRICVFGASITYGACDHEGGGWVTRLNKYVKVNDYDYSVYNLGISGDTTDDLLKRLDIETKARNPEIIIFGIGVNDSSYRQSLNGSYVPLERFKTNLETLKQKANGFTDKVIFVGLTPVDEDRTTPIPWNTDASYENKDVKKYDKIVKDLCKKNNLLFIEMYDLLDKDDLGDGLHPNSAGHEKMFQRIKDFLIKNKII